MSIIKKQGFHFAMRNLDRTDRLILEILQQQARISISELAAKVNLAQTGLSAWSVKVLSQVIMRG